MEIQLIQLYVLVCRFYDVHPELRLRVTRNCQQPTISAEELVTIYLFGHLNKHFREARHSSLHSALLGRLVSGAAPTKPSIGG